MVRTKVKYLAKQIRGVSYKPEDLHDSLDDDCVILLRANNIDEGKINFDDVVYVDKSKVSDEQYLKVGDVLICASSGSKQLVGKAASVDFDSPCTFGAFCKVVRPNYGVADYLGKYFQSGVYRRKISEVAIGANINNIRNEHIDSLELPIYEPEKTRRIVEKVGMLQSIIENRESELSKLDQLIKARFVEMFDLDNCQRELLGDCTDFVDYRGHTPELSDDGTIRMVNAKSVGKGFFKYVDEYVTEETYDSWMHRGFGYPGDILFVTEGHTFGNTCLIPEDMTKFALGQRVITIKGHAEIKNAFLCSYMQTDMFWKDINVYRTGGTAQGIRSKDLVKVGVPIPPIEKQEEFMVFVKQIDKSKVAVQKALDEARLLFDSLMQEYFG